MRTFFRWKREHSKGLARSRVESIGNTRVNEVSTPGVTVLLRFGGHKTKTGEAQFKGEQRTFIIPGLGALQRVKGKVASSMDSLIYSFQRRPKLKAWLGFFGVAQRTFNQEFDKQFRKAFNRG